MTAFQHMAFLVFLDQLERKPQEPHVQRAAASLATTEDVLETLETMEMMKGCDEDYASAYRLAYQWVKPAWDAVVQDLGLSASDYLALLKFKKEGVVVNEYEEDHEEEEAKAEECLRDLKCSTAPVLVAYKEPLVRLLELFMSA